MQQSTYSFLDSIIVLAHPLAPTPIVITGEGVGSVTVTMSNDRTAMDVGADGAVMVSKMADNTGTVTFDVQQTSNAYKKLLALFNQVWNADTSAWATGTITIRNTSDGTGHVCTGVAFVRLGEKKYERAGGRVAWSMMAADIQSIVGV